MLQSYRIYVRLKQVRELRTTRDCGPTYSGNRPIASIANYAQKLRIDKFQTAHPMSECIALSSAIWLDDSLT
jgi:hypothetical protein